MKFKTFALIAVVAAFFAVTLTHAQTNAVAVSNAVASLAQTNAPSVPAVLAPSLADGSLNNLLLAFITVLVPLVVAGIKKVLPAVPAVFLPILATLVGLLAAYLASLSGGLTVNPVWGLLLGAAGVGVREIKDQLFPATPDGTPASPAAPPKTPGT